MPAEPAGRMLGVWGRSPPCPPLCAGSAPSGRCAARQGASRPLGNIWAPEASTRPPAARNRMAIERAARRSHPAGDGRRL